MVDPGEVEESKRAPQPFDPPAVTFRGDGVQSNSGFPQCWPSLAERHQLVRRRSSDEPVQKEMRMAVIHYSEIGSGYGGYNQDHEFFGFRQSLLWPAQTVHGKLAIDGHAHRGPGLP